MDASRADNSFQPAVRCDVSGGDSTTLRGLRRAGRVLLSFGIVMLLGSRWSMADEPLSVRVGFDQSWKVGRWTPVVVEKASPNARACEVTVTDPDGVGVSYPLMRQASGAESGPTRWTGVVRIGRLDGGLDVRVLNDGSTPLQQRRILFSQTSNGGSEPSGQSEASTGLALRQSEPVWLEIGTAIELLKPVGAIHVIRPETLPEAVEIPWSLDGVDGIWLNSRVALRDSARTELERWLRRGGHLVVTISTDAEEFDRTPWSDMLKEMVTVRDRSRTTDLSGLEGYTGHARKILGGNRTPVPVTTLSPKQGQTLVSCLEGALLTRASEGFGQVTVFGIDPTVSPFSRWDGLKVFVRRLLVGATDTDSTKSPSRSSLSQSGITDLASQWRAAVIEMPDVARPTLWGVLGLLLAYAAVIGPLDYLLVHKLLKRPQWTWASLPLLVAVTSLGTVWLARAANGDAAKLTQLDVVDIDAGRQEEVIARSWATAYATENTRWTAEAIPVRLAARHPQRIVSWLGFPENASGGLYRESGLGLGRGDARTLPDRSALVEIPFTQWSSKSLTSEATWINETPLIESQLVATVAGELDGPVVHHLPFELCDWIVVFEKWIYRPHPKFGEAATIWRAGQTWTPKDERNYGRELRGFLQRATISKKQAKKGTVQEDVLVEKERYNPLNLDPADILQMMTLHEAAGGKSYTGLDHHSLRAFDVTPLLSLDRAIVIARVAEPTTEWRFNGEARTPTRHHSFVRILLPVRRVGDASGFRYLPKLEPNAPSTPAADQKPKDNDSAPATNETKSP